MDAFFEFLDAVNAVLWHDVVLYFVLATGVLFTVWTKGCQWHSLTHGVAVVSGKYDKPDDPGAIRHFPKLTNELTLANR